MYLFRIFILAVFFITPYATASETDIFDIDGFVETRLGTRLQEDPLQKDTSITEIRLQMETEKDFEAATFNLVMDLVYDPVLDSHTPDLETGEGFIDLRQLNFVFSPVDIMDVKIGRQILTWGTGDLLFINDLFAKDWNAFIIGRDVEYLKAPTDAIKFSIFNDAVNFDIVYTPTFNPDRYIDGKRLSFFDPGTGMPRGRDNPLETEVPNDAFDDDEVSIRAYKNIAALETALYYYNGFWKSPAGIDAATGNATFPPLQVFGASLRGPLAGGIAYTEIGYYKSDDNAATNPLSRNSELRYLLGYEKEIITELLIGVQYYLEYKLGYDDYLANLLDPAFADSKYRHVLTLRLTQLLLQQNLRLSLFNFYSSTDSDGYARLNISYKFTDRVKAEAGLNYFYGEEAHTFYSQLENNNNVYTAVRYNY